MLAVSSCLYDCTRGLQFPVTFHVNEEVLEFRQQSQAISAAGLAVNKRFLVLHTGMSRAQMALSVASSCQLPWWSALLSRRQRSSCSAPFQRSSEPR